MSDIFRECEEQRARADALEAKLDICKRYAEGEAADGDCADLANDYGGKGYENDPAVQLVARLQQNYVKLLHGQMICPGCVGRGGQDSAEDSHECGWCAGKGRVTFEELRKETCRILTENNSLKLHRRAETEDANKWNIRAIELITENAKLKEELQSEKALAVPRINEIARLRTEAAQITPLKNSDIRLVRDQALEIQRLKRLVALLSPFLVTAVEDMIQEVQETDNSETKDLLERFGDALRRAALKKETQNG